MVSDESPMASFTCTISTRDCWGKIEANPNVTQPVEARRATTSTGETSFSIPPFQGRANAAEVQ